MQRNSTLKRRYRLHKKLRKKCVKFDPFNKIIYVPVLQELENNDVTELAQNYKYNIQFIIE